MVALAYDVRERIRQSEEYFKTLRSSVAAAQTIEIANSNKQTVDEDFEANDNTTIAIDVNLCSTCGKILASIKSLDKHIQSVHLKIKNFFCKHCPKAYYQKMHFDVHMKRYHNP